MAVAGPRRLRYPQRDRMNHWGFVLAAYGVAAAVLLGYWWRVEHRIRSLEAGERGRK